MHGDSRLQKSVLAELSWEPSVTAAHIGVTANDGVVSLSGHVGSFAEKHAIEVATRRVKGVKALVECIEVRLASDHERDDDEIAKAALDRLAWHATDPDFAIDVGVEKGCMTLTGQVDWQFQKEAAEADMRRLWGVVGLDNQITIKPKVSASNVNDDITHALHRSWFFDENTIDVSAEGGTVRLTGTVHSPHDKYVAGTTAWAAPGVTQVKNDIRIV